MYPILTLLIVTIVLAACGPEPAGVDEEPQAIGVFRESRCPITVPEGLVEGDSILCGTVAVPEFHDNPASQRLLLPVAVFPAKGPNPSAEPMFVATAGPGTSGIESIAPDVAGPLGDALLMHRDLVLIDYRGLPLADPNLMCPEIIDANFRALEQPLSAEEAMAIQVEATTGCRDRLIAEGIKLSAYNNTETASDIVMAMSALGYEKFHVYGTSAGSILAQHLLRDHSDHLRSVIIDSTVPIGRGNVHVEAPTIASQTLDAVLDRCEEDEACDTAYPDLSGKVDDLIQRLDRDPVAVEVQHPLTGAPFTMQLTGHRVAQGILMLNSQTATVGLLPRFIHELAMGETALVRDLAWAIVPPSGSFSWALGTTVFCTEYSDYSADEIAYPGIFPAYENHIATQAFGALTLAKTCDIWGVDPIPPELRRQPEADVPVLLIAGAFDSLTPPVWAEEVADSLPQARLIEVDGYAHSPTFSGECTAMIALQFFADPIRPLDTSCLANVGVEFQLTE